MVYLRHDETLESSAVLDEDDGLERRTTALAHTSSPHPCIDLDARGVPLFLYLACLLTCRLCSCLIEADASHRHLEKSLGKRPSHFRQICSASSALLFSPILHYKLASSAPLKLVACLSDHGRILPDH